MAGKIKETYPCSASSFIDPEDGSYDLADPQNFDEYIALIRDGTATERHHDEFDLRMIWHFCECVDTGKKPKNWVLLAISKAFFKITMGGRWEDEFPLPWTERTEANPQTITEKKDIKIFREIFDRLMADSNLDITSTITDVARENYVSYEKARAAYYKYKKKFFGNRPLPYRKRLIE